MKSLAKGVLTGSRAPWLCWGQQGNRRINRYSQHRGKPELEINQWDSSRLANGLQFLPKAFLFFLHSSYIHLHSTVIFGRSVTLWITKLEDWSEEVWTISVYCVCFVNIKPSGLLSEPPGVPYSTSQQHCVITLADISEIPKSVSVGY